MTQDDYYTILNLSRSATEEDIKRAFRKEAFKYHPDRNPNNTSAEERFKKINEAYSVLSDQGKRKMYDTGQYYDATTQQTNPFYTHRTSQEQQGFTENGNPFEWYTWTSDDFQQRQENRRTTYGREDAWGFILHGTITIMATVFASRFLLFFNFIGVFFGFLFISRGIRLIRQGLRLLRIT